MAGASDRRPGTTWRRRLARAAAVLVVLLVAVYLARVPLFGGLVRRRAADALGAALGGRVEIGGVSGGWLTDVAFEDVRLVEPPGTGALTGVRAARVEIEFRPLHLRHDVLGALDAVVVDGFDVTLDLDRPRSEHPAPTVAQVLAALPSPLPQIAVRGRAAAHGTPLGDAHAALDVVAGGDVARVALAELSFDDARFPSALELRALRTAGGVEFATGAVWEGAELRAARLSDDDDGRTRLELAWEVAGGAVEVRSVAGATEVHVAGVDVAAVSPVLGRLVLGDVELPRAGVVSADVQVDATTGVAFHATCSALAWHGVRCDDVTVTGALAGGVLRLGDLRARREGAELAVGSAEIALGATPRLRRLEALRLDTADAAPLLEELGATDVVARLPRPAALHLRATAPEGAPLALEELTLRTPRSALHATGTLTPPADAAVWRDAALALAVEGGVDAAEAHGLAPAAWQLPALAGAVRLTASIDGPLAALRAALDVAGEGLVVDGRTLRAAHVAARLDEHTLTVEELVADGELGRVRAAGTVDLASGVARDGTFALDVPDLAALSEAFPRLPRLAGALRASGELAGSLATRAGAVDAFPPDLRADFAADGEGLVLDGLALGRLDASARLAGPRLEVERLAVDGRTLRLAAAGTADLATGAVHVPGLALEIADLAALRTRLPLPADVEGALALDGAFDHEGGTPWEDAAFAGTCRAERIATGGVLVRDLAARVRAERRHVELQDARATLPWGDVHCAATIDATTATPSARVTAGGARLDGAALGLAAEHVDLELTAPLDLVWDAGVLGFVGLEARALGGRVRGAGALADDPLLHVTWEDVDAATLADGLAGRLSGTLRRLADDDAVLDARATDLTWQGVRAACEVHVVQDARGVRIERLHVDAGALLRADGGGALGVRWTGGRLVRTSGASDAFELHVRSDAPAPWFERFAPAGLRAAALALDVQASVEDGAPTLLARLAAQDVAWADAAGTHALVGATTAALRTDAAGAHLLLAHTPQVQGPPGALPLELSGQLDVAAACDWRDPQAAWAALRDGALSGRVRVVAAEIADLAAQLPGMRYVRGAVSADLVASGTPAAPHLVGDVEARGLTVRLEGDAPAIDRVRLRGRVEGRELRLLECTGRVGYAPASASGAVRLTPAGDVELDVAVTGRNLLLARTSDLRLRADVDVTAAGPLDALRVAGVVSVTDALVTRRMSLTGGTALDEGPGVQVFELRDAPWADARLDLRVIAADTVRIDNDLVRGTLSVDVRVRGTGAVPEPEGRVDFRDATVSLPLTRLRVEAGSIVFPVGAPFAPQVRARAATRLKGYDLDVTATGELADMRVHVAATPPLSQQDALVLLATGAAPEDVAAEGVGRTALATAGALLGEAVLAWFTGPGEPGEESLTDRVTVEVGRERSEKGASTIEAELELRRERFYLRIERDRWDDYDAGVLWRVRFR